MDSGSSGSIQSSSAGDDDYDSRADGTSACLNAHVGPMANPVFPAATQPHLHHHLRPHSSSSIFDPFSNFFDLLPPRSHQNSLLNLDTVCPRNPRPDQNPTELGGLVPPSSTSHTHHHNPPLTTKLQVPRQVAESNAPRGLPLTDRSDVANNDGKNGVRNPRKRTRASRRAPTTVLTTDTSNFRAMVQEFTGIPAPPFTPASSFPRARLDVFGTSSPYLLRPIPHKLSPPFSSPSTTTLLSSPSDFLLPKHNFPTTNSILNLQPPQLQPASKPRVSAESTESDRRSPHLHTGFLQDFSLSQSHDAAHLSGNASLRDNNINNILPAGWGPGGAASDPALFRPVTGKYCNGKLHYSASSSDFHGDKGSENVTTRSEGMIESWICSSD